MKIIALVIFIVVLLFGFVVFRGAPYVPSKKRDIKKVFRELYPISNADVLVDIGSGDGVVLREAVRAGAKKAVGIELNPLLVVISRLLSRHTAAVEVRLADFWLTKLPEETTVIYTFGESRDIEKMARRVESEAQRLGRPLYFISYGFALSSRSYEKASTVHFLYRFEPLQGKQA
jgi:hypothetical protein